MRKVKKEVPCSFFIQIRECEPRTVAKKQALISNALSLLIIIASLARVQTRRTRAN